MYLEQTRIRVDVLCPQLRHHRLHLVGPIVFAIREHVPSRLGFTLPECGAPGCGEYFAPDIQMPLSPDK
jgi:hypothetical protein